MKRYEVLITPTALADMEAIYEYIAEDLLQPNTAMGQYNRIAEAIEHLDVFPERIKVMESLFAKSNQLRQMIVDNFSVIFRIKSDKVEVIRVLYSASNIDWRLRELEN